MNGKITHVDDTQKNTRNGLDWLEAELADTLKESPISIVGATSIRTWLSRVLTALGGMEMVKPSGIVWLQPFWLEKVWTRGAGIVPAYCNIIAASTGIVSAIAFVACPAAVAGAALGSV